MVVDKGQGTRKRIIFSSSKEGSQYRMTKTENPPQLITLFRDKKINITKTVKIF